jgi:hypothetical protein
MKKILLVLVLMLAPVYVMATPLNVTLDQGTFMGLVAFLCMILTQIWKKGIAPKVLGTTHASPWISMGIGVVVAVVVGWTEGISIQTIIGGILSGGIGSYTFDLGKSIGKGLEVIGIKKG